MPIRHSTLPRPATGRLRYRSMSPILRSGTRSARPIPRYAPPWRGHSRKPRPKRRDRLASGFRMGCGLGAGASVVSRSRSSPTHRSRSTRIGGSMGRFNVRGSSGADRATHTKLMLSATASLFSAVNLWASGATSQAATGVVKSGLDCQALRQRTADQNGYPHGRSLSRIGIAEHATISSWALSREYRTSSEVNRPY